MKRQSRGVALSLPSGRHRGRPLQGDSLRIALGADHAGFPLKEELKAYLEGQGIIYDDLGTYSPEPVDYPDIALRVAEAVAQGRFERGILICGTGIGASVAANKVPGVRAALCHDTFSARCSRAHNDSNILTLGARVIGFGLAKEIVNVWLNTEFEGGRHAVRLEKIKRIEERFGGGRGKAKVDSLAGYRAKSPPPLRERR